MVGTEGTCVVILETTVRRLVDNPPSRSLLVLGYPDVFSAGDHVPEILKHKPIGLEGIDSRQVADMKAINLHPEDIQLLPEGGWPNSAAITKTSPTHCLQRLQRRLSGQCRYATYKAEFLSHYYQRIRRPREAYAFGWINRSAALASYAPGFSQLMKNAAGIAPQPSIPQFAPETFIHWFKRREPQNQDKSPVILWPDTFNNYFHPETAKAAVEVLEAAGFQVRLPELHICCGRPLYDFGMLDRAKQQLRRIVIATGQEIDSCTPMVGLEPACVAVFRDELVNLFPSDEAAQQLSR